MPTPTGPIKTTGRLVRAYRRQRSRQNCMASDCGAAKSGSTRWGFVIYIRDRRLACHRSSPRANVRLSNAAVRHHLCGSRVSSFCGTSPLSPLLCQERGACTVISGQGDPATFEKVYYNWGDPLLLRSHLDPKRRWLLRHFPGRPSPAEATEGPSVAKRSPVPVPSRWRRPITWICVNLCESIFWRV